MKSLLHHLYVIILLLIIAVFFLPLIYMCFLAITLIVPPLLFGTYLFEDRKGKKPHTAENVSLQFFSIMICLPLVLIMTTAILRSVLTAAYSFHPPALFHWNKIHSDIIYSNFIPVFGDLFPYWLDFYWGMTGVIVLLGMALMDSLRRNRLVRQIEILQTSKVHSAAIGMVELKGKAVPVRGSGEDPIIRSYTYQTKEGSYGTQTSTNPFYLDDGTGRVLIDPIGCDVSSIDSAFEINLHHALLKPCIAEKGLPETRLMPDDEVYVLGNLRINDNSKNDSDKVIIKPQKFTFDGFNIYDVFFVSNTSEEELLAACKKAITHGWKGVFITMLLPAWLAINAWTNITQLKTLELESASDFFRFVSTATVLDRSISIEDLGTHPTLYWLEQLKKDRAKTDEIMKALKKHDLDKLAIHILEKQAKDIKD